MDNYLGEVRIFAGNYAPEGWQFCNGQSLSVSEYQALYSLIGTTYGGDGVNTFALPDLRGRVPVGVGSGPGLTPRVLGQSGGSEEVALVESQIPAHGHNLTVNTSEASTATPSQNMLPSSVSAGFYRPSTGTNVLKEDLSVNACSLSGGAQGHVNIMPSFCLNFIIAVTGTYPPQP